VGIEIDHLLTELAIKPRHDRDNEDEHGDAEHDADDRDQSDDGKERALRFEVAEREKKTKRQFQIADTVDGNRFRFQNDSTRFEGEATRLEPDWMAGFEPPGVTSIHMPARSDVSAVAKVSGVEPQSGNHREGMTAARIDRDPPSASSLPEAEKIARGQRLIQNPSVVKREGNRAGTIVTRVRERAVAATPVIRLGANTIYRPDRGFDVRWGI
jgi:hypothetical protein